MEVAPFFVDIHHLLSIFTIFYRFSRFTHFCRDLHFVAIYALFPQIFFGQNSLLRNITRFLHVCPQGPRRLRKKRGVYFPPLWTISIFLLYPKLPTWTKWEMCGWLNSNGRESATCQSGQSHTDSMLREKKKNVIFFS